MCEAHEIVWYGLDKTCSQEEIAGREVPAGRLSLSMTSYVTMRVMEVFPRGDLFVSIGLVSLLRGFERT